MNIITRIKTGNRMSQIVIQTSTLSYFSWKM